MNEQAQGLFFHEVCSLGSFLVRERLPAYITTEDGNVGWYCCDERAFNAFKTDMEKCVARRKEAGRPALLKVTCF